MDLHPLLSTNPLAAEWEAAQQPNAAGYVAALVKLAQSRAELPSPVFVKTPDEWLDEQWQRIFALSTPMCKCGHRRVILPEKGRSRFTPASPAQRVVVSRDNPLLLAPWGGDKQATCLKFEIRGADLVGTMLPFEPPPLYPHEVPGILMVANQPRPNEQIFRLADAARLVRRHGENICMQPYGNVAVPLCSLVDVGVYEVTFEIDAGARVIPNDLAEPRHECVAS